MANRKTALITGASSGIGKEFAVQLAKDGYDFVLVARREDRLKELAADLEARHGSTSLTIPLDLTGPGAGEALMTELASAAWGVDLLINNAGLGLRARFHEGDLGRQMEMIDINCRVVAELAHRFLNHMLDERRGTAEGIINIGSLAAWQPGPWMATYFASKAFVLHLSEAMYEDVKHQGLMVSVVNPGGVHTEFAEVADMADASHFKYGATTPEPVVRAAIKGFRAKRPVVVPGAANGLAAFGIRFAPRFLTRTLAQKIMAPKG